MQKALAVAAILVGPHFACACNRTGGVLGRARRNDQALLRCRGEADGAIYGSWFLQDASRGGEFNKDDQDLYFAVRFCSLRRWTLRSPNRGPL